MAKKDDAVNIIFESTSDHDVLIDNKNSEHIETSTSINESTANASAEDNKQIKTKVLQKYLKDLDDLMPLPLQWVTVSKNGIYSAEILISAELIQVC